MTQSWEPSFFFFRVVPLDVISFQVCFILMAVSCFSYTCIVFLRLEHGVRDASHAALTRERGFDQF